MKAKHDGRCGVCDEPVCEGDEIELVDDEWCHEHCAEAER